MYFAKFTLLITLLFSSGVAIAQDNIHTKEQKLTQELVQPIFMNAISYQPLNEEIKDKVFMQWGHIIKSCQRSLKVTTK